MLWFYHKIVVKGLLGHSCVTVSYWKQTQSLLALTGTWKAGHFVLLAYCSLVCDTKKKKTMKIKWWTERHSLQHPSLYYSWTLGTCAPNGRNIPCKFVWQITQDIQLHLSPLPLFVQVSKMNYAAKMEALLNVFQLTGKLEPQHRRAVKTHINTAPHVRWLA